MAVTTTKWQEKIDDGCGDFQDWVVEWTAGSGSKDMLRVYHNGDAVDSYYPFSGLRFDRQDYLPNDAWPQLVKDKWCQGVEEVRVGAGVIAWESRTRGWYGRTQCRDEVTITVSEPDSVGGGWKFDVRFGWLSKMMMPSDVMAAVHGKVVELQRMLDELEWSTTNVSDGKRRNIMKAFERQLFRLR